MTSPLIEAARFPLAGLPLLNGPRSLARRARQEMERAECYEAWREAAQRADQASGAARWRDEEVSPQYDHRLIRRNLDELRRLRDAEDAPGLLFALNEGVHGNLGGMGNASLYQHTAFGTKSLIVAYVEAVSEALEYLGAEDGGELRSQEKQDLFHRASICYGHTALMLSGSGTLLFFHVGVCRALAEQGLLPRVISGSSGGALVAAMAGTRSPEALLDTLTVETFAPLIGRRRPWRRSLRQEALERGPELAAELYPDLTFEEARQRSGLSINVSIAPTDLHQRSRVLNAITAPHVFIREAILASTAVPGAFQPVTLAARGRDGQRRDYLPDRKWLDGSLSDDLPAKKLARLFGVNHYIVSQTNPHVLPFLIDAKLDTDAYSVLLRTTQRTVRELVNGGAHLLSRPLRVSPRLTKTMNNALSVINQDYLGDINIVLPRTLNNPFKLLDYRSEREAQALIDIGARSTWPRIEMIRVQTKISRTLDRLLSAELP